MIKIALLIETAIIIIGLFMMARFLKTKYLNRKNSLHIKQVNRKLMKINHASPELIEIIASGKEFNSLLFNSKGAFIVLEDK